MQVIKPQKRVSSEWLWQFQDGDRFIDVFDSPSDTWLIFGVFYLDKFDNDPHSKLEKLLNQLNDEICIWNHKYPWSEFNGISLQLDKTAQGVPFILGQICVEDNVVEEEAIVVALLQKFTSKCGMPQVFVKVCDTDGDFLLAEASDTIPEDYEYPVSINRLWIHEGKFKLIPKEYYEHRGLNHEEALKFLRNNYYKLIVIDGIQRKISQGITNKYPEGFLDNLVKLPLVFEDSQALSITNANPRIISFALKNLITEEIEVNKEVSQVNDGQRKEFLVPRRFVDLLSLFLDSKGLKKSPDHIPLYCGRAVASVINSLLRSSIINVNSNAGSLPGNNTGYFDSHKFQMASLNEPFKMDYNNDNVENIVERLGEFFKQGNDRKTSSDHEQEVQQDSDDDDEKARQFFRDENVDIDEDDFFEFFLADALKMNKDNIEALRSQEEQNESSTSSENPGSLDGYEELLADGDGLEGLSPSALGDLLKALAIDGATEGPLQTILRNAAGHQNDEL
ncbi:hypothetical protein ZYGR_0S02080 [Zygosaccharomyces rouxii]|uniref:ZYRO0F07172p n=2 Tax=Zygosaccharomyces rouxii TaxID=4956 RepID=C5DXR3_ZYGRC|nr:uncharacterized protein ZYRO0F07172g [Zygosaccharomyces rouxii]KAH9199334.1 SGT1 protein-domain-containing protein [Zygosaccharomyces rouxii]GAV50074.1 hypothetical protein ZYGR_0S02080 [Zygosaccharomyces rouxii]CAR28574.1 ZYRO0F07172p [Zygosaccharomyces rouxii]